MTHKCYLELSRTYHLVTSYHLEMNIHMNIGRKEFSIENSLKQQEGGGKERGQSLILIWDSGCRYKQEPWLFFFLKPSSSFHKCICLQTPWYQQRFSCPKHGRGFPWRCWRWSMRNLSKTSIKIASNCSESKESSMQSHWNNKKQAFYILNKECI